MKMMSHSMNAKYMSNFTLGNNLFEIDTCFYQKQMGTMATKQVRKDKVS